MMCGMQVGAQTETELKEKKLRVEDALNATKAAVEEGIVIGGGCTLLRLAGLVDGIKGEVRSWRQPCVRSCTVAVPSRMRIRVCDCVPVAARRIG